jgi:hypothetical protein
MGLQVGVGRWSNKVRVGKDRRQAVVSDSWENRRDACATVVGVFWGSQTEESSGWSCCMVIAQCQDDSLHFDLGVT